MFAFGLWDRRRARLVLGRDRLGIKPLYIAVTSAELLFASEAKALIAAGVPAALNRAVVPEVLANRFVAGEATLFRDITRLAPGHLLTWSMRDGIDSRPYWQVPRRLGTRAATMPQATALVKEGLRDSVERHLMSDVPIGVFLSGGIDSTALAALAARLTRERLCTFSVGFHEDEGNELPYARLAARAIGADHRDVQIGADDFFDRLAGLVWQQDDPLAFSSSVPLNVVSELAQPHVKVVLTGEGADELFLGYNRYRVTHWNSRLGAPYWRLMPASMRGWIRGELDRLPARVRRYARRTFAAHDADCRGLYFDNFSVFAAQDLEPLLVDRDAAARDPFAFALDCYDRVDGSALDRMAATDLQTYLGELLIKQDRMSMAASIESRVPFLDDRLVQLVLDLPAGVKLRGWRTKAVLREAVADLVPPAILHRRKMGFPVPIARWFRGTHRHIAREFVAGHRAAARGLFRPGHLRRLVDEHEAGVRDHAERLWLLTNLEIWQRVFCDGEHAADVMAAARAPGKGRHASGLDQGRRPVAAQHRRAPADV
jgi:asparagine synthase (glutamine-hydrolysing)